MVPMSIDSASPGCESLGARIDNIQHREQPHFEVVAVASLHCHDLLIVVIENPIPDQLNSLSSSHEE